MILSGHIYDPWINLPPLDIQVPQILFSPLAASDPGRLVFSGVKGFPLILAQV